MENIVVDIEKETKEYQEEIYNKYFYSEIEEERETVKRLISLYENEELAKKIYAGKHKIGFVTNQEEYKDKQRIIDYRKRKFEEYARDIESGI